MIVQKCHSEKCTDEARKRVSFQVWNFASQDLPETYILFSLARCPLQGKGLKLSSSKTKLNVIPELMCN